MLKRVKYTLYTSVIFIISLAEDLIYSYNYERNINKPLKKDLK
jgi:hypothetical protein